MQSESISQFIAPLVLEASGNVTGKIMHFGRASAAKEMKDQG
jgi:hypothetical protein